MGAAVSWRDRAKPIITRVLAETAGQSDADVRKALYEAYPFGERAMHPYKIWLDEIKRQRGTAIKHGPCACGHAHGSHHARRGACVAADCTCKGYTMETRQEALPL